MSVMVRAVEMAALVVALVSGLVEPRIRLTYRSHGSDRPTRMQAEDNAIVICDSPTQCLSGGLDHLFLTFSSLQEYTSDGLPIANTNEFNQKHSILGYNNFIVNDEKKEDSRMCSRDKKYMDTESKCRGIYFTAYISPRKDISGAYYSNIRIHFDTVIFQDSSQVVLRNNEGYSVPVNAMDVHMKMTLQGWCFCNSLHFDCHYVQDLGQMNHTYLLLTMQLRVTRGFITKVESTNHNVQYTYSDGTVVYIGKFYLRRYYQSGEIVDEEWLKMEPGYPSTDFNNLFTLRLEESPTHLDESVFDIVIRPGFHSRNDDYHFPSDDHSDDDSL